MRKIIFGVVLCTTLAACVTRYETRVQPMPQGYVVPPAAQQGYAVPAPQPVPQAYVAPAPQPVPQDYAPPGTIGANKTTGGALVGAGVGGLIGSKLGHGKGKDVATVLGVIAGGLLGSQVGASLDRADQAQLHTTTVTALETAPPGQALPWSNPNTGNYGSVVPQGVYQTADGQYCREFQQTIVVGGQQEHGFGKACRQPDGSWKVVQ
ncbi:MAG TPA: RT0821/Lpp0805 family surface protein [Stellaceae bacterium]